MAGIKVLAHHALVGTAVLGLFAASSDLAYRAAGAALSLSLDTLVVHR